MKIHQWNTIRNIVEGQHQGPPPAALIIDSPWIPGHLGISTLDYLTVPEVWLEANLQVEAQFPDVIFLPGFWMETGMAAEPSGFGCRVNLFPDKTPHTHALTSDIEAIYRIDTPDPRMDGWMPVILNYYRRMEPRVRDAGHVIKMVAARGPLTLATHLMGVSEFLLAMKLEPDKTKQLLRTTTTLVRNWLEAQVEVLSEVESVLVLDDIAGFMSAADYQEFAHPCLKEIFDAFPGAIKMFHNDTDNPVSFEFLPDLGIHIFNFTHLQSLPEVRKRVGPDLVLLGNVPPLTVLTQGTRDDVFQSATDCLQSLPDRSRLILSAGGGTSPGTPGENINALVEASQKFKPEPQSC